MSQRSGREKRKKTRAAPLDPPESRASEAVTIAWTSAVTGVFIADLIVIAAHLYARANPEAQAAKVLEAIMLLSAAAMGCISLALFAVVWQTRKRKPPRGYSAFSVLVAIAPVIALLSRLFR